eukprot:scaffold45529_cov55-Phaeocystis_antarctica.AAC.2
MEVLAVAKHACLIRPHLALRVHAHVAIPGLVTGAAGQRESLRPRLSHRLLRCHWRGQGRGGAGGSPPLGCSRDVKRRLLSCGEDAEMHGLAVARHACVIRPRLPANVGAFHTNVAKPALVIGPGQRQPLRLRLRQRLLRRHRRGQGCKMLRLGRSGDVQRRLLSRGEAAEGDLLAVAPHDCLVRPRLALRVQDHVAKPALANRAADQCQPLRLRLRQRLLRCHRRWQARRSLPLRRPRDVQRRLLSRGKEAEKDVLAVTPHPCLVRPRRVVGFHSHVSKPALGIGAGQRQPLRFSQRHHLHRCHRRGQGHGGAGSSPRLGRSGDVQRRLLGRGEVSDIDSLAVAPHVCLVRPPRAAGSQRHIAKPSLVSGAAGQRQPLRLRLRQRLRRRHRRRQGRGSPRLGRPRNVQRLGRPRNVQRRLLGRRGAGVVDWLAVARRQRPRLVVGLRRHVAAALVGQR